MRERRENSIPELHHIIIFFCEDTKSSYFMIFLPIRHIIEIGVDFQYTGGKNQGQNRSIAMNDAGASALARLKNKALSTGKPFSLYLQLFCQEEFLQRVSLSKYASNLVLKGGMFIYTLTHFDSRSTVDIDFLLHQLPNNAEVIQRIFDEIITVDTCNDLIALRRLTETRCGRASARACHAEAIRMTTR